MADIVPYYCHHRLHPASSRSCAGYYSADLGAVWGNALL